MERATRSPATPAVVRGRGRIVGSRQRLLDALLDALEHALSILDLAPLVPQVSGQPEDRAETEEEDTKEPTRDQIRDLRGDELGSPDAEVAEEQGDQPGSDEHYRGDTIPLLADLGHDVHVSFTPRCRTIVAAPSVKIAAATTAR